MAGFRVRSGGLFTTVQDYGIVGYQKYGISQSGVMDVSSYELANALVSAPKGAAALECTYGGLEIEFDTDVAVAIAGADVFPLIDGAPAAMNESYLIRSGSVLTLGTPKHGLRTYVAFGAELEIPYYANSKSTSIRTGAGGFMGRKLAGGDVLTLVNFRKFVKKVLPCSPSMFFSPECTIIRVLAGPQDDYFTERGLSTFLGGSEYTITQHSDRMGMRLSGEHIEAAGGYDIISDAAVRGSVQVPADGMPIVLLSDRQTTGGYAKIATVLSPDIDRLAQMRPGEKIVFAGCTSDEAEALYREYAIRKSAAF